jgi:hypothetical protein
LAPQSAGDSWCCCGRPMGSSCAPSLPFSSLPPKKQSPLKSFIIFWRLLFYWGDKTLSRYMLFLKFSVGEQITIP